MEDELRFGADHYLKKMLERKSFLESFWGGIKVTCVFMALVSNLQNLGPTVKDWQDRLCADISYSLSKPPTGCGVR